MADPRLSKMAWRNLWRHRRRTLLTLAAIAFGITIATIGTGVQDSSWANMIDLAARLGGGHVTLQHHEYQHTPTLSRTVRADPLRDLALGDPEVERVVARITGQVMLSTAAQSYGAGFIAFDPQAEDTSTLSILEALSEGTLFEAADSKGIILGRRLAENLDARLGRKVVFTMTDRDGEIVRDVARVSGILETGAPTVDGALVLFPIDRMRGVLGYAPDEATQVGVFLADQRRAERVAARLGDQVESGTAALTWSETQPDLAAFIAMKVGGAVVMEVVIAILVAAGIFNTLFVSVMERIREFGIMLALGFSQLQVFAVVMYESLFLALVGLVGAALVGAGPYYYLNATGIDITAQFEIGGSEVAGVALTPIMYADIYTNNLLFILAAAVLATLLAGIYPAWKAGSIEPVDSIRLV